MEREPRCPDCDAFDSSTFTRRRFVQTVGVSAAAVSAASLPSISFAAEEKNRAPKTESLVKKLYNSLSSKQKESVHFAWDHQRPNHSLPLRLHVSNNWQITKPTVASDFFTGDQQDLIEAIFWSLYNPEWYDRIKKQLRDDAGGYGKRQSIAIFGEPGTGKFEFVMTGRHLTIRCDGDTQEHVAFGGPIFYGHAAQGFNEAPNHPGNVFWHQALSANKLYEMLDGKQRKQALILNAPDEAAVHFRQGDAKFDGLAASELSKDQQAHLQSVLKTLIEPYRDADRKEALACLEAQGGLDKCHVAFYESDDVGEDGVWDTWRLEGPSFVWHFRGNPHVHVWVSVANDPSVKISTAG